jgi:hypothetical protein
MVDIRAQRAQRAQRGENKKLEEIMKIYTQNYYMLSI